MLISKCHSDGLFTGPAETSGLPEAHGPPKVHEPRGHCTPLPPLSVALRGATMGAEGSSACRLGGWVV